MEAQMENDRRPGRGRRLVDAANGWREGMTLRAQVPGALPHYVGPEIWDEARGDVVASEAETIADDVGPELLTSADERGREGLRGRVIDEMNAALVDVGDTYLAPDGIRYSLSGEGELDPPADEGRLDHEMSAGEQRPTVVEVLRFEDLPLGSGASRRGSRARAAGGCGGWSPCRSDPVRAGGRWFAGATGRRARRFASTAKCLC